MNMKLNKAIKDRWSPRAFSEETVTNEMIALLFEAARWAPSARNEQPWMYFYAKKEDAKSFRSLLNLLTGNNPDWAQNAQVLMVSVLKKNYDYKNRPNKNALHDLGAANVSMAIQASEMGLQVHQMGGFDVNLALEFLNLDEQKYLPVTAIALGFPGDASTLPNDLKQRELAPRKRKQLTEFVKRL